MTDTSSGSVVWGALALRPGGAGVQTYQRELIRAAVGAGSGRTFAAVVQHDVVDELPPAVAPLGRPVTTGARRAVSGLRPVRLDGVFHSLDVDLPVGQRGPCVSTVHDMSAFDTPWAFGAVRARAGRALLRRSMRRADAVIAVSAFTADRIRELTGRTATVTPLAPAGWTRVPGHDEVEAVRRKYDLPDRFVLQLGTLEPGKNPHVVAESARDLGVPMVLGGAGTDGPNRPPGSLGLGFVDQSDVPALYRAADVVTYASRYEGFGLPPVEAMACGGVVAASGVGGIPESVGDGAVVVGGYTVGSWTPVLRELLEDRGRRAELRAEAARVVRARTWDAVAAETLTVYDSVG
ncbi:glycosyltransferase family 1 protein [Rhodococcus sp. IEGM 1408]|uniref:glycosyltransferase family 4 protein n=1 Tax=Rhodococcus sp. IEGM 1408 TaxID=3082220 RepID=UPI00295448AA|nr:glycosyltransferase family 1 protein [Rhodococcus sp. IEGM 1408]MDV8000351.1 glycosyltransferase family 1 protein [Rhodococcus sp. IEGM 1408]